MSFRREARCREIPALPDRMEGVLMFREKKCGVFPLPQFLAGLFWLCLAAVVLAGLLSLPKAEEGGIGPRAFPFGLAVLLIVLSVLYLFQSRKQDGVEIFEGETKDIRKMFLLVTLSLCAAFLWEPLGAYPVLLVFCLTELRWIEEYPWKKVIGISALSVATVWLVFTKALGLNLPLGILLRFIA